MEYKNRYDYYMHNLQIESQKSYKRLLKKLPVGILLLDKENKPVFYNSLIDSILRKKKGSSSGHSQLQRGEADLEVNQKKEVSDMH